MERCFDTMASVTCGRKPELSRSAEKTGAANPVQRRHRKPRRVKIGHGQADVG